jgi:hypothetical protein
MANTVLLKKKTSALYLGNTPFCVWAYEVMLDEEGAAAAAAELRLGFSARIAIEDPKRHTQIAALSATKLIKEEGATLQFVARQISDGGAGAYDVALLAPCSDDEFTPIMLMGAMDEESEYQPLKFGTAAGGIENITRWLMAHRRRRLTPMPSRRRTANRYSPTRASLSGSTNRSLAGIRHCTASGSQAR